MPSCAARTAARLPRRARGRMARAEEILAPAERGHRVRALDDEDLLRAAGPLSRRPLLALGGAGDLARPGADQLSRGALRARLFLRLWRADLGRGAGSPPSSRATGRWRCRALWRETLVSLALTADRRARRLSARDNDPDWYYDFVPPDLAGGRDPQRLGRVPARPLYDTPATNGAQHLRRPSCSPTTPDRDLLLRARASPSACRPLMLLIHNGRDARRHPRALRRRRASGFEMGGWLIIHGIDRDLRDHPRRRGGLPDRLGVVFPGEETRLDAATRAGRTSALAMAGVVVMLACAGLLEGIGRQIDHQTTWRATRSG